MFVLPKVRDDILGWDCLITISLRTGDFPHLTSDFMFAQLALLGGELTSFSTVSARKVIIAVDNQLLGISVAERGILIGTVAFGANFIVIGNLFKALRADIVHIFS